MRTNPIRDQKQDAIRIGPAPTGGGVRLEATLFLPYDREHVFEFFADAFQLESLTPPWLHFSVITPAPIHIATGTLIDYRLRLCGVPVRWQSRISLWEPPMRFIDEQTRGPYRRWRHEHLFQAVDGGTVCRDIVDYQAPGGRLIDALFVRRSLLKIFQYRQSQLRKVFAPPKDSSAAFIGQTSRNS